MRYGNNSTIDNVFSGVHGGDALSFYVAADNRRNKGSYATARKAIEKKEYIRHLWVAESSTFLDRR